MKGKNPIAATAVFDIGKTNKKFFLFDEDYTIIKQQKTTLNQIEDEDVDPCEDLRLLEQWVKNNVQETLQDRSVKIKALNFSTYGASFVHLNEKGRRITPLYDYLKPYPDDLLRTFYETYGDKKQFSLETASPPMGMLNSGLQLYWLKYKKPSAYQKIHCSLHFPQYLSYLFTEKCKSELTSIGCHTGLWNFREKKYHQWLRQEDCLQLLPSPSPVSGTTKVIFQDESFQVGTGIHDSSAALAPYLLALDDPFMLVSTGTWSITFNPFNKNPLTYQDLKKDCLCYLNIYEKRVKAARFFLGGEYQYQKQKISTHFDDETWSRGIKLDVKLLNKLVQQKDPSRKLKLEQAHSSGPHPEDKPGSWQINHFTSPKEAYHQLMLDLGAIQTESTKLAQGSEEVKSLIITGGFSQNDFFIKLLASFFPDKKVYTSSLTNASAFGAAMVIHDTDAKNNVKELLALQHHHPPKGLNLKGYTWKESVVT